jgi:hypothetical protein
LSPIVTGAWPAPGSVEFDVELAAVVCVAGVELVVVMIVWGAVVV